MLGGICSHLLLCYRILFGGSSSYRSELCFVYRFTDGFVHCIYIILDIQYNPCKPSYEDADSLHNLPAREHAA
jgi:hypothetical protein